LNREFFADRNLGRRFPATLMAAGITVHRHDDHFLQDCPDQEWLTAVGERRWVALTCDHRIRYKPNELQAVISARATLLVLSGKAPLAELAANFVNSVAKVHAFLDMHEPPLIAKVYRPGAAELLKNPIAAGTIELWYPKL
jgi:hypothetical protein